MFTTKSGIKTTYMLGAGASALALPTVKAIKNGPSVIQNSLADDIFYVARMCEDYKDIQNENEAYLESIITNLKWLSEEGKKYTTVDTFAKYLYLTNREDLNRLKRTLGFYFSYKQFVEKKIDYRANVFLINVMSNGAVFPPNINILSWNYDVQIQLASEIFREEKLSKLAGATLHSPPLIQYYPGIGLGYNDISQFQLLHLNGIAGYYNNPSSSMTLNLHYNSKPVDINELIKKIKEVETTYPTLQFAFEEDVNNKNTKNIYTNNISETQILVIIGYSFPFYNRETDNEIFNVLKQSGQLKKIYFQDPTRSGNFLRGRFELPDNIEIVDIGEVENYHIPMEL